MSLVDGAASPWPLAARVRQVTLAVRVTATCMFVLLLTSQFTPAIAERRETPGKIAQEDHVVTARASSTTKADACSSSVDKAYNLCIIQGFFNITRTDCDCTQSDVPGAPTWECVGSATCKK